MKYNTPMDGFYNFSPQFAFDVVEKHWKQWHADIRPDCYVVGISGGIDSSCVAALACKIFGKDKVVGVSLPCDGQKDMDDVNEVFAFLGVRRLTIDIGDMFSLGKNAIESNGLEVSDVCKTNMPARLRMAMLYGIAQSINGIVLNTCNRSESIVGNDTLFGDDCGSYAPIQSLTKTEVREIASWLGLPEKLVKKTPIDGLQPLSDEERLGVSYDAIDAFIRSTAPVSASDEALIISKFFKNKFKLDIVHIPGPDFSHYPDKIRSLYS